MNGFALSGVPTFKNISTSDVLSQLHLCDIGINILDDMFSGKYNDKNYHDPDVNDIIDRSKSMGVTSLICTAGSMEESIDTLAFCRDRPESRLYCTVGIHPTRSTVFSGDSGAIIKQLDDILIDGMVDGKVVAIGECGLDYDRLHFCSKELQLIGFKSQLVQAAKYSLPLFLHNRNTEGDFARIISEHIHELPAGGVVHSFTGSVEEMQQLVVLGLYIGINGCSLRTEEGLAVVKEIPAHLLLLETDAPWCGVKASHAGHKYVDTTFPALKRDKHKPGVLVKDRNEPCTLIQVLEIVAKVRECGLLELAQQVQRNTAALFKI